MKRDEDAWQDDFPIREEVEDARGCVRVFQITCHELALGFTLRAVEEDKDEGGYVFGAFSETSPYLALGKLRTKLRRELSVRYVTRASGEIRLLHERMKGRIEYNETRGIHLVVDGLPLDPDDLERILGSHEGWEFDLAITDALD